MSAVRFCRIFPAMVALSGFFCWATMAQRFLADDPIHSDPDNLNINKPERVELGPTWDFVTNTFGHEAKGPLVRAQNVNTLGEVPDSSWFENRLGMRAMSIDQIARGNDMTGGPEAARGLTFVGAALLSLSEGLIVRDGRGELYYLILDPREHPGLVTGASTVANRVFHAAGYHVLPSYLIEIDPSRIPVSPTARILQLEGKTSPMTQEYVDLTLERAAHLANGDYRAVAIHLPRGAGSAGLGPNGSFVGEFQFHGRRSDDPNDLYLHENRRELRGMRLFAAWLNFSYCDAMVTRDLWYSDGENRYLKHFLADFSGALGSGRDFEDRPVPKDARSGHEHYLVGNPDWTLKTAVSLGFWYRPWMKIPYPSLQFPELGRIEGDHFQPESWVPEYPNPAFSRMLPEDAFWAARIIDRFSDSRIDAIVGEAHYRDPAAGELLSRILKQRRDRIVQYAYRQVNPLDDFKIEGRSLTFRNLGEERAIASVDAYEYEWFELNNETGALSQPHEGGESSSTMVAIPDSSARILMVRIRTRAEEAPEWRTSMDVYLRIDKDPDVVGIEREAGTVVPGHPGDDR